MNKNTLLKAIAVFLIISVCILTLFGCSKKKSDADKTTSSNGIEKVEITGDDSGDGTSVYSYDSVDINGKSKTCTVVVDTNSDNYNNVNNEGSLSSSVSSKKGKKNFVSTAQNKYEGMNEITAGQIADNAKSWVEFSYNFYIKNTSENYMYMYNIKTESNGSTDIWVESNLGATLGIPAGGMQMITVEGLINSKKYKTQDEMNTAFKKLNVSICFAETKSMNSDVDWDTATTKLMQINS